MKRLPIQIILVLIVILAACYSFVRAEQPIAAAASAGPSGRAETAPAGLAPGDVYSSYLRLNQVGYLPAEPKFALALTDDNLNGQTFNVVAASGGNIAFTGTVTAAADRGAYGNFAHLYELGFSDLNVPGRYRVRLGSAASPTFTLGADVYGGVISPTLQFFHVQRCGDTSPALHGVCHLKDGIAAGGPVSSTLVNATGGWHDAGDYLKFLITTGASTNLMLTAYQRHPEVFADADRNSTPDVLDEARMGLDWILKLWDPANQVLYYQVGDESDHDTWRMPEGDDAARPTRPVWACEDGKGANVAGKAAAALALAAALWNDPARSFYSPTLASTYRTAAQQIYTYGQARPAAQSSTSGFYDETTWQDDMALAAAELYRATGDTAYLSDAHGYAAAAGNAWSLDYDNMHGLAHYELARLDPTYAPTATTLLADDLSSMQADADANPFHAAVSQFYWGSAGAMVGTALEALWYKDLAGNATYDALAQAQRDYVLGGNPWGVGWVNSLGVTWPHYPHHQVADLTYSELVGFWDEGPMPRADWEALGITLSAPDVYTTFQSDAAVYHDDVADYATNEPTIIANALGLALVSWYAPPQPAQAMVYYVATDGDDDNPGTLLQPWRTVQKAASSLGPGDSVYVRAGVYTEAVTITVSGSAEGGYITFQNYPGETPVLDGTGLVVPDDANGLILIINQGYLIIKGFEIRNYQTATPDLVPVGIHIRGMAHHIQLVNNHIHHIQTHATPQGPDLLGADAHGIAVYGTAAPTSTHNILVDGNELDHLKLGSSESVVVNGNVEIFTITHNLVHDNDNIGIVCIGFEETSPDPAYDQARDGTVAGNTVYNIDSLNNPSYGGGRSADGIYVDGGTRILIERNRVSLSNIGIEIASEHQGRSTSYVTVRSNLVFNNHIVGIAMGGYDAERGNTENCIVVNNTLYNNDTQEDGNGEMMLQFDTGNNTIKNNILYAGSQSLLIANAYTQTTANAVDYNIFYAPDGINGSQWQWQDTTYTGFSAYQAGSGNDANSLFVDPQLVNLSLPDLHLGPASPAINTGENLAAVGDYDIDGEARVQGDRVDIGADEYPLSSTLSITGTGWYTFGADICGAVYFTHTGSVNTVMITLTHVYPSINGDGLPRRYDIVADGSGFAAQLALCYEDDELNVAGISSGEESNLHLYRYDLSGGDWVTYSLVNTVTNRITATLVTEFGVWGMGTPTHHPTTVGWFDLRAAANTTWLWLALTGAGLFFTGVWWLRKRVEQHHTQNHHSKLL